jgi:predicted amidohydrolase
MFDYMIINGNIVDGTGLSSYLSDLGIKDGKIAAIEVCPPSPREKPSMSRGWLLLPDILISTPIPI